MIQFKFKDNEVREISSTSETTLFREIIQNKRLDCLKISIDELGIVELDDKGRTYKLAVTNDKRAMLKINNDGFDLLTPYDLEKIKAMTLIDPFQTEEAPYEVKQIF